MNYEKFIKAKGLNPDDFSSAWAFCLGNPWENLEDAESLDHPEYFKMVDELADLVMKKIKTATASDYASYSINNAPIPEVNGKFDIVLNSQGQPVCAIQTTKVYVVKFDEVTAEHAFKEGEGDRSLNYWRRVHEDFFRTFGSFSSDMEILCEEFQVIS